MIVVGVNLVPIVADTTFDATTQNNGTPGFTIGTNVTGAGATLIDLVPLFFVIGLVILTVQSSVAVLSKMGIA